MTHDHGFEHHPDHEHHEHQDNGAGGSYLLFLWSPAGYTLREEHGEPPEVGHEFEDGGQTHVVNKIGVSPLPGDRRTCVFSVGKR